MTKWGKKHRLIDIFFYLWYVCCKSRNYQQDNQFNRYIDEILTLQKLLTSVKFE
jgi:hypothetical protein